ncbi:MAG: translation initiation factor IF-2 [Candidatus Syntropharchaeia archaeon]
MKELRTPIVCVVGHIDHGKTTLLDKIRGTAVARKEAGGITQHIGATEVPITTIKKICSSLIERKFDVPGLLFIDTPGHHAFTSLRSRGGALADLAVLVIDVFDGFKPQTYESLNILKRFKTPFVVAVNKIDRLHGWRAKEDAPFLVSYEKQAEHVKNALDEKIYEIIEKLHESGFSSDRYDRIRDFQKNVGLVPISAKTGEGIPDLLMILVGLAQRFLEENLKFHSTGAGVGTILEIKEEKGVGVTADVILYDGRISVGDTIVVGGEKPVVTKVKGLLKPRPLSEIRTERKFQRVKSVTAAAGVKIVAADLEKALSGLELRVADNNVEEIVKEMESRFSEIKIDTEKEGIIIKADTLGSLEALIHELKEARIPIQSADVGHISKKDVIRASTIKDPLLSVILGFNVDVFPDAREEAKKQNVSILLGDVIYSLLEDYDRWVLEKRAYFEKKRFEEIVKPGIFRILPDCIFRQSKPAIVGVRVVCGTIKPGVDLIKEDGTSVGRIKGIQDRGEGIPYAEVGREVAVAIEGPTIGRQVKENDLLYVDVPKKHVKVIETELYDLLREDEREAMEKFLSIKRKSNLFWGKQ